MWLTLIILQLSLTLPYLRFSLKNGLFNLRDRSLLKQDLEWGADFVEGENAFNFVPLGHQDDIISVNL